MPRSTAFLPLVAALLLTSPLPAQSPEGGPTVLRIPPSTAALAFGGAFPVAEAEAGSLFAQPGVLERARGVGLALQRWGSGARLLDAAGARGWWSGGIAVGVRALAYGGGAPSPAEHDLFAVGGPTASELLGTVGYGHEVGAFGVGAAAKWLERRVGGSRNATGAADLGVTLPLSEAVVGVAVQNLGPALGDDGETAELPRRVRADASFSDLRLGPLDLGAAASLVRRVDGEIVPSGGLEVAWWPVQGRTFVARAGLSRVPEGPGRPVSFGGGFYGDDIGIEYAYRSFAGAGETHRIGLRWR